MIESYCTSSLHPCVVKNCLEKPRLLKRQQHCRCSNYHLISCRNTFNTFQENSCSNLKMSDTTKKTSSATKPWKVKKKKSLPEVTFEILEAPPPKSVNYGIKSEPTSSYIDVYSGDGPKFVVPMAILRSFTNINTAFANGELLRYFFTFFRWYTLKSQSIW